MAVIRRILPLVFLLGACVNAPTTVSDSDMSLLQRAYEFEKSSRPIKIKQDTIVLDTRAFFDYQLLRIPSSIYVDANEFSLRKLQGEELENRAVKLARRFALMGINPFSHVVVIGYGAQGRGEEGTVALALLALGVERVQVGTFNSFKFLATNKKAPEHPNQRYWEPRVVKSVGCNAHGMTEGLVIDVSGKSSTLAGSTKRTATLNKDWKDFVNADDFSPNYRVRDVLRSHEVGENALVMVRGGQAPLVVFSLLQMGYKSVCMLDE